jgi:hypothetical protein
MSKIMQLNPVSFTWKDGPRRGEPDIGFNAQEVEEIVPEVVYTDQNGMKYLDYPKLVPILVGAIQENQAAIDELKAAVAERKRALQETERNNLATD